MPFGTALCSLLICVRRRRCSQPPCRPARRIQRAAALWRGGQRGHVRDGSALGARPPPCGLAQLLHHVGRLRAVVHTAVSVPVMLSWMCAALTVDPTTTASWLDSKRPRRPRSTRCVSRKRVLSMVHPCCTLSLHTIYDVVARSNALVDDFPGSLARSYLS